MSNQTESSMIKRNKYSGCFLGLATGDAFGAPYEGGIFERLLWKLIGKTKDGRIRYTDDTQMSIDLARSFLHNKQINQKHLAYAFAKSYHWSRGYGPSTAWLLRKISKGANWQDVNRAKFKDGSFGNGAAMRAPIVAMCFSEDKETINKNVIKASEITHAHPLAMEGTKLIAFVTHAALHDWDTESIMKKLPSWCESDKYKAKVAFCIKSINSTNNVSNKELKNNLGNGIAALQSCVTAIYYALNFRYQTFDLMLTQIYKLGGDTDTIAAMAGAIWGAFNGSDAIDSDKIKTLEDSEEIIRLSDLLYQESLVPRPKF